VGLNSLKSLNLTNVYPNNNKNNKKNNNNNKVKSKPLELRSRVKMISQNGLKIAYSQFSSSVGEGGGVPEHLAGGPGGNFF
jgi:hypothetical protein